PWLRSTSSCRTTRLCVSRINRDTSLAVQALFSSRTLLIVRRISAAYWSPVDRTVRMVRDCNTQGVSSYTIHPTKEKPMPINEPHEDLPARRPNGNAPVPSDEQMIAAPIAAAWWEQFQAGPDFRRARAIPELPLRASAVSQRCDRQFWYSLTDIEPTDASDAASVFRMRLGSIVHDELDKSDVLKGHTANGHKWGWFPEEAIDLRPAGFPGSAHGDWIFYDDNQPLEVAEIKTVGGYGYKLMASNFNGPPEGPKWEHAMQAAIVAVAVG